MKLIDANKEIAFLRSWQKELDKDSNREYNLLEMIIHGIENEPAAYDVGKVILEIVKSYDSCENCKLIKAHECNSGNCQIKEVIDIVKNGGTI